MQRTDRRVAQRQGYVADSEPVDRFAGMGFLICFDLLADPVEQVGFLQPGIVLVDLDHGIVSLALVLFIPP